MSDDFIDVKHDILCSEAGFGYFIGATWNAIQIYSLKEKTAPKSIETAKPNRIIGFKLCSK